MFSNHFIDDVRGTVSNQFNETQKGKKIKTKKTKKQALCEGVPKEKIDRVIDTVIYRFTTYYCKKMLKEQQNTFCDRNVDMNNRVINFD